MVRLVCTDGSWAAKRSRVSNKASGFCPQSASSKAKRLPTILATRFPNPRSVSRSCCVLLPVKRSNLSQTVAPVPVLSGKCSIPSARMACAKSRKPRSAASVCASVLRWWRIRERARPVRTKFSQAGLGVASVCVSISTTSPFRISVCNGIGLLLTFAETVWSPTLLWIA